MSTIREQADAVECCALEWRNSNDRLAKLPQGRGGVDPAALKLKRMREDALFEAASNLRRWADKVDARDAERGAA